MVAAYQRLAPDERGVPRTAAAHRAQWFILGALTFAAAVVLAAKIARAGVTDLRAPAWPAGAAMNGTVGIGRRRRWDRLSMGRMGAASSFFLRSRRRSIKKQAAKAATRSVVLIGSHFDLGNALLKRVFGELVRPPPSHRSSGPGTLAPLRRGVAAPSARHCAPS